MDFSVYVVHQSDNVSTHYLFLSTQCQLKVNWWRDQTLPSPNQKFALCKSYFSPSFVWNLSGDLAQSNTSAYLQSSLVCWALKMLIGIFKKERKYRITIPPPPVTACQNAIFQIRLYLDNLLNCNRFPASRHITIGTSLLNKSDTEPSLCRRRQINVRHRANNISSASRVTGLSLGCYIGFISLSAGEGLLTEVSKFMSSPYMWEEHAWIGCCVRAL